MRDKQAITRLQLLKTIKPSKIILNDMKQHVYQQGDARSQIKIIFRVQRWFDNISPILKSNRIVTYGTVFSLLSLFFLVIWSLSNQIHNTLLAERLAIAPNQYEKARIVLADTMTRFGEDRSIEQNTQALSQSLALTNRELNNLKLRGEKGQYTEQECHQIYQVYLSYLEKEEKNILVNNQSPFSLKSQIHSYEEQAEKKLHIYNSL